MLESGLQSCGTVVVLLLRAERARKRSSAGVVARGRPGTGLLDTESSVVTSRSETESTSEHSDVANNGLSGAVHQGPQPQALTSDLQASRTCVNFSHI
ncbi:hypothetical protein TNCV_4338071 [Trichonephila clavipes]|uniref:Uncharacterized protein n=1 Tax=Trichonephila clavipes TaxID=2585209 RepID=A0A8X6SYS6_TRICX|nr:hypothetical protein TNCV_4338071 [Trichonephila clavipes]